MSLIVQKFGGTSVATPERIRRVAERVARERRAGNDVVVVVSAMGDATDELLALAEAVASEPRRRHARELDMLLTAGERIAMALLAMAVREQGLEAVSLTGSQAAIITDDEHTDAHIEEVRATRVSEALARGSVVIVAGFQGVSRHREVTTLGRGGSDTTAVALAAALGAARCDVYTDVDGVYTADPRRVPDARRIPVVDYDDMVEMATSGAQVMHPRAVEIGARFGVPIRVLSSFRDTEENGTLITTTDSRMQPIEGMTLTGLASERGHARLTVRGIPAGMDAVSRALALFAEAGVSLDMVAEVERPGGHADLQLTLSEETLPEAETVARELIRELGGEGFESRGSLTRVSLVGSGMHGMPGVYAREFEALRSAGVEVFAMSSSGMSIRVLVRSEDEDAALRALHDAFGMAGRP